MVLFSPFAGIVEQGDDFEQCPLMMCQVRIEVGDKRLLDVFKRFDALDGMQVDRVVVITVELRKMYFAKELEDYEYPSEKIAAALKDLPKVDL